jgi:hypothetical protein
MRIIQAGLPAHSSHTAATRLWPYFSTSGRMIGGQ